MAKNMFANLNAIVANTLTDSIKMIDIADLHESADNFYTISRVDELADTILGQGGVKDNLIVRPMETGGYEIISGHRRRAAVQMLIDRGENISHLLPCLVQEYADEESKMLDLVLMNVSARQLSDAELWQSYEKVDKILKEKKSAGEKFGRVRETLANMLGVSPAQVGKMQNVEKNAIPEVKEAIEKGDISISTANEIAKLDEESQEEFVAADLSKVQHKDVKEISDNSNSKSIKWDGSFAAEAIRNILFLWIDEEVIALAATMKNNDYAEHLRKIKRNSGKGENGIEVWGSFDKVRIRFRSRSTGYADVDNSDVYEITFTWSMAARQIRAWVSEEQEAETEEYSITEAPEEKVDTYINFSDNNIADKEAAPLTVEEFVCKHMRVITEMCVDYIEYGCNNEDDVLIVEQFKKLIESAYK